MSFNKAKLTLVTIMAAMVLSTPSFAKDTVKKKIAKMPYRVWASDNTDNTDTTENIDTTVEKKMPYRVWASN